MDLSSLWCLAWHLDWDWDLLLVDTAAETMTRVVDF